MADLAECQHPRLESWAPAEGPWARGSLCLECSATGSTTLRAVHGPVGPEHAALEGSCVCGERWRWPPTETGSVVAQWLAEHTDCTPPAADCRAV